MWSPVGGSRAATPRERLRLVLPAVHSWASYPPRSVEAAPARPATLACGMISPGNHSAGLMGESDLEKTLASFDWRAITPEDSPKTPLDLRDDPVLQDLSTPSLAPKDPAYDFEHAWGSHRWGVAESWARQNREST